MSVSSVARSTVELSSAEGTRLPRPPEPGAPNVTWPDCELALRDAPIQRCQIVGARDIAKRDLISSDLRQAATVLKRELAVGSKAHPRQRGEAHCRSRSQELTAKADASCVVLLRSKTHRLAIGDCDRDRRTAAQRASSLS